MCQTRRKQPWGESTYLRIVFVAVCISFYFTLSSENYPSKLFRILVNLDSFFAKKEFLVQNVSIFHIGNIVNITLSKENFLDIIIYAF